MAPDANLQPKIILAWPQQAYITTYRHYDVAQSTRSKHQSNLNASFPFAPISTLFHQQLHL